MWQTEKKTARNSYGKKTKMKENERQQQQKWQKQTKRQIHTIYLHVTWVSKTECDTS